jgi:hypothetical protein
VPTIHDGLQQAGYDHPDQLDGSLQMVTDPLDLPGLLATADDG